MKSIIIGLFILFLTSCQSDNFNDDYESSAVITGPNIGACICCTGWFIDIDTLDELKWFEDLPKDSGIDLQNIIFPVVVKVNWTERDNGCPSIIDIDDIKLME